MKINDELIENLLKDKSGLHQKKNTKNLTKTLVEKYKDPNTSQKKKKEIRELFRRLYK
jgi:SOS response regulatory protein OraA/RecX